MSIEEENKAAARRSIEEVWNKGNLAYADECIAPGYTWHNPVIEVKGPDGFKEMVSTMHSAFPDLHTMVNNIVAEDDIVAIQVTMSGTMKGEFMGNTPTNKKMTIAGADFIRFSQGKEIEAWSYSDSLSMFQQLGVSPPT
jgi:steroid delta-isomerase-like uncharacterized protein